MERDDVGGCFLFAGLISLTILIIYAFSVFHYSEWVPWRMQQERKAIVQSNAFIETQQEKIRDALQQFDKLQRDIDFYEGTPENADMVEGMKRSQVDHVQDACDASDDIPDDEIPNKERVIPLMLEVGCWSPDNQETQ